MSIKEIWFGLNREGLSVLLNLTLPEVLSLMIIVLGVGIWIALISYQFKK